MIHIITIHWKTESWIDIQLKYFKHFINEPYKVYTFLNHIPNNHQHKNKFFYSSTENIRSHPIKLNLLADMACFEAKSDDDVLMFIDGDAFPVGNISEFKSATLTQFPLAAIQRLDNNGDIQPHPCFCLTTVGYWKNIGGDWKPGQITWTNDLNEEVADVGGKLLSLLKKRKEKWYKLLRSNAHNLHPVLFGIYDDLIYHHGAGFRKPGIRADQKNIKFYKLKLLMFNFSKRILPFQTARKLFFPLNQTIEINKNLSQSVYKQIEQDFHFFEKFK